MILIANSLKSNEYVFGTCDGTSKNVMKRGKLSQEVMQLARKSTHIKFNIAVIYIMYL